LGCLSADSRPSDPSNWARRSKYTASCTTQVHQKATCCTTLFDMPIKMIYSLMYDLLSNTLTTNRSAAWSICMLNDCLGWDKLVLNEFTYTLQTRDALEWLFTFPLPPIPVQSIPIPSHSHSRTLHRCSINYFWDRENSSLNMPLKLTISCVHFYSTETRKIVVENIISFDL